MTVLLDLEPETESRPEKKAEADGCDVTGYLKKLIEKDVNREQTIDEILAPFAKRLKKAVFRMTSWTVFLHKPAKKCLKLKRNARNLENRAAMRSCF